MKSHYRGHKMAIWLNLIPQLHQPGDDDVSMRHHHFHERAESYYDGLVAPEHQTRLPLPYIPTGANFGTTTVAECPPNISATTPYDEEEDGEDVDDNGILQRLADSGYHSYATALGITVGVGCLLLLLNVLIFAGIYYQRERSRRRNRTRGRGTPTSSESGTELSDCTRGAHVIKLHEPPPYYNVLNKSAAVPEAPPPPRVKDPPQPPMRTTSNPTATIKKRVQIQEISV